MVSDNGWVFDGDPVDLPKQVDTAAGINKKEEDEIATYEYIRDLFKEDAPVPQSFGFCIVIGLKEHELGYCKDGSTYRVGVIRGEKIKFSQKEKPKKDHKELIAFADKMKKKFKWKKK